MKRRFLFIGLVFCTAVLLSNCGAGPPIPSWSGTRFVALGESGTILTSPDGVTWISRASGTTNNITGIAWSGTQFVAVGGSILTSPDGVTWASRKSDDNSLWGIAWSGTQFVAVGWEGTILTSPDGITWTSRT